MGWPFFMEVVRMTCFGIYQNKKGCLFGDSLFHYIASAIKVQLLRGIFR